MYAFTGRNRAAWAALGLLAAVAAWAWFRGAGGRLAAAGRPAEQAPAIVEELYTQPELSGGGDMPVANTQGQVEHASQANFGQLVLQSEVPVLVDFYADWCGPCKMLAPALEEVARETPNARVVKVNVDDHPQLAARYGVSAIPSLKVFRDGRVVAEHVGLAGKAQLKALLGG